MLKSSKYDIIHFHSLLACFPFIILVPFIKSKIVWSVHGELDFHARKLGRTELKNIAFSIYKLLKAKFIFHSTCNQETQFIKDMMGRNTRIIQEQIVMRIPKRIECNKKDYCNPPRWYHSMSRRHNDHMVNSISTATNCNTSSDIMLN